MMNIEYLQNFQKKVTPKLKLEKKAMVVEVENTLVKQVKEGGEGSDKYIVIEKGLVYMVRPYVYEFLTAIEPHYYLIAFSNIGVKILKEIIRQLEKKRRFFSLVIDQFLPSNATLLSSNPLSIIAAIN